MPSVSFKIALKVSVDLFLLVSVALPILLFYLLGVPFKRGFFCNDETIRYPFKDSTVTSEALYGFGTIIPVFFITVIEYFHVKKTLVTSASREKVQRWIWSLYFYIGIFLFGCALSHLTVDICKYAVGRLRPHFIDVCKPDWSKVVCDEKGVYVTEDVCSPETTEDYDLLREARLSFISGHASFATYTMLYLIFYLQYRLCIPNFPLVRPVLQYLCFGVAVFTSLSRISDHKHHWSDVLTGCMNGLIFAVFCAFWVANIHSTRNCPKNSSEIRMHNLNGCHDNPE